MLGMARSGTSTIARALKVFNIDLGNQLAPPRALWNPKGFFEDVDLVYKVNRRLMHEINFSWKSIGHMDKLSKHSGTLQKLKSQAIKIIDNRYGQSLHWGFKDPRTAKLLPFWQSVFDELNLKAHYIITCRNPLASAYSYQRVAGADIEFGLLLWLLHLIPAIRDTMNHRRIFVNYENILANPHKELARLEKFIELPIDDKAKTEYERQFLDKGLSHFNFTTDDLRTHSALKVAPYIMQLYELCYDASLDARPEDFANRWLQIKAIFDQQYPLLCYLDVWSKRHKQLERQLRSIKKSVPWMLASPLRFIEQMLRMLIKNKKLKYEY